MNEDIMAYHEQPSALQIRLDTRPLIERLETFIRGEREVVRQDSEGNPVLVKVRVGEPYANEKGIQSIMQRVEGIINPQVVQGNFTEEMYLEWLSRFRTALAKSFMMNLYDYGIKPNRYEELIDGIMAIIEAFMSRLLYNAERDSYKNIKITSNEVLQSPGGGY